MDKHKSGVNVTQILVTSVLVLAGFLIGMLWTKVKYLENGGSLANAGTTTGTVANNQPSGQPASADIDYSSIATQLGLNPKDFQSCIDSGQMASTVKAGETSGTNAGVNGTPGNILLDTQTGKTIVVAGAVPFDQLKQSIEQLMSDKGTSDVKVDPVVETDHVLGNRNARYALVEYSDFECPFCKSFFPTAQQAQSTYKDQLMWVYRQFPLTQIHPHAQKLAEASECATKMGGNDAFWKYAGIVEKL